LLTGFVVIFEGIQAAGTGAQNFWINSNPTNGRVIVGRSSAFVLCSGTDSYLNVLENLRVITSAKPVCSLHQQVYYSCSDSSISVMRQHAIHQSMISGSLPIIRSAACCGDVLLSFEASHFFSGS
jgi:hypothetical protein